MCGEPSNWFSSSRLPFPARAGPACCALSDLMPPSRARGAFDEVERERRFDRTDRRPASHPDLRGGDPKRTQVARAADNNKPADILQVIDRVLHLVVRGWSRNARSPSPATVRPRILSKRSDGPAPSRGKVADRRATQLTGCPTSDFEVNLVRSLQLRRYVDIAPVGVQSLFNRIALGDSHGNHGKQAFLTVYRWNICGHGGCCVGPRRRYQEIRELVGRRRKSGL